MSCANTFDFCIATGETFDPVFRWGTSDLTSKPITGISQAAPAVVTAVGHGAPNGWPVAVVSAKGMTEINAKNYPPVATDYIQASTVDADNLKLTTVNSADYSAYTSGGFLIYQTPADLSAATASFRVWETADRLGTPLLTLTVGSGITLDNTNKTISILQSTSALAWSLGYYALDLTVGSVDTRLSEGKITIS